MSQVYVARKSCGCIVAAFPTNIDKAVKGELLKQLAKGGYDIDQTTDGEVRNRFDVACQRNRPPLLAFMEDNKASIEGVDQADIDAAASEDLTPGENADELLDELADEGDEDLQEDVDLTLDEVEAAREAEIEAGAENVWNPETVEQPAATDAPF